MLIRPLSLAFVCLLAAGCARLPTGTSERPIQVPSPNHDERRPNFVIIHQTSNDYVEDALRTLTNPARKVSAHYLIARDGTVFQLVDEGRRAWHAGVSWWGGNTDLNSSSIGIELDNNGDETFAEPQIVRLIDLLQDLRERYKIPTANFIGHGDIAPRRKVDPSRFFPWERLAQQGFGLWCHQPDPAAETEAEIADMTDPMLALQAIGYDIADPEVTLAAFRRHFLATDDGGEITPAEKRLMRCLVREKRNRLQAP